MNRFICIALVVLVGCKEKNKPEVPEANFFPVTAYLRGELSRMDSSLAPFYKVETENGQSDTVPIKNTAVKTYAADFLQLPDITTDKLKDDYKVEHIYDDMQNAFVFAFTTNEEHPVKKEFVTVEPQLNEEGKNDIRSVFIEVWSKNGDTTTRKNMLWETGKKFEIITTTYWGETENTKKLQVFWNNIESINP